MSTSTFSPLDRPSQKFFTRPVTTVDTPAFSRFKNNAQVMRLRRRQALTVNAPDTVLFVQSGLIAAEHATLGCERTMVELLYPGDIIATAAAHPAPTISYSTVSPSEVWRISSAALRHDMAIDPGLSDYVLQRLNLQRARMQLHISMLAALPSEQRVAALLLQAASHLGTAFGDTVSFDMPLSRTEVAEYLALNADTLSRIMSRLTREGVLARSSRTQITVRNMAALKAHCPLSDAVLALHKQQ